MNERIEAEETTCRVNDIAATVPHITSDSTFCMRVAHKLLEEGLVIGDGVVLIYQCVYEYQYQYIRRNSMEIHRHYTHTHASTMETRDKQARLAH